MVEHFGARGAPTSKFRGRRLNMTDNKAKVKYIWHLEVAVARGKLIGKARGILAATSFPMPEPLKREYNSLAKEMETTMHNTKKNCRRLHMSGVWSSLELKRVMLTITYWKGMRNKTSGGRVSGRWLRRLKKFLRITEEELNEQEINFRLKTAYKQYYEHKMQKT